MVWLTEDMPWVEIILGAISRHLQYDAARYRIFSLTGRIWLCPIHQSEQNEWEWNSWSDKCSGGDKQPETTRFSQRWVRRTPIGHSYHATEAFYPRHVWTVGRKHSLDRGWSVEHNRHLPWTETRKIQREAPVGWSLKVSVFIDLYNVG